MNCDAMSIYDCREKSAYQEVNISPEHCKNEYVLKWWTSVHDELLLKIIKTDGWGWYWKITEEIMRITSSEIIEDWKNKDPLCSKYAWYNVIMYFALSRADNLGFTKNIKKPEWRICPLCNEKFIENSLPQPLIERLGINQIDFCAPCLRDTVLQNTGDDTLSKEEIIQYLKDLSNEIKRVPSQNYGEGMYDLYGLNTTERLAILKILKRKPIASHVKKVFGSWLKALIEAEILEDGTRRMNRGTQCLAKDGHVCNSLGEKTIDDLLSALGIPHEKEPKYPEENYRADFKVNNVFIEYFGLTGNPEYDEKTKMKKILCEKYRITLVSLFPMDLIDSKKLEEKISKIKTAPMAV